MFEFFRQLDSLLSTGQVGFFFIFFLFVTSLWLTKIAVSTRYKQSDDLYRKPVSVIIPVVDEPPEIFDEVLFRISAQYPQEIIVVINGPKNIVLESIAEKYHAKHVHLPNPGKRPAVAAGVLMARGEIIVLVDSDTFLDINCLSNLTKPFKDPKVGGVTTHQDIGNPNVNLITRFGAWMERTRSQWSMPAMSSFGTVGCLPGRTIAFRADVLRKIIHPFLNEKFLGFHPEISDDRSLTNLTLKLGYKTVYQRSARVTTPSPTTIRKFLKQQLRWSRGSQYNTIMMSKWMIKKAKFLCLLYWSEIIVPFWLASIYLLTISKFAIMGAPFTSVVMAHLALAFVGSIISLFFRQAWVFRKDYRSLIWLPVILLMVTIIMVPLRIYGFLICGFPSNWGTRNGAIEKTSSRSPQRFIPIALGLGMIAIFYVLGLLII